MPRVNATSKASLAVLYVYCFINVTVQKGMLFLCPQASDSVCEDHAAEHRLAADIVEQRAGHLCPPLRPECCWVLQQHQCPTESRAVTWWTMDTGLHQSERSVCLNFPIGKDKNMVGEIQQPVRKHFVSHFHLGGGEQIREWTFGEQCKIFFFNEAWEEDANLYVFSNCL